MTNNLYGKPILYGIQLIHIKYWSYIELANLINKINYILI